MKYFFKENKFTFGLGIFIGVMICLLVMFSLLKYKPNWLYSPPVASGPQLQTISEETANFYKSKFVTVRSGKNSGSGCEIKPGVYLTALHVVNNTYWDKVPILVNGTQATILGHSNTENDFAILTTNKNEDKKSAIIPNYDFKIGDNLIIVGSPGNEKALVEPGLIINETVQNEDGSLKVFSKKISSLYIESGLSGGCVYVPGSSNPVGIVIKKENDVNHKIGEISLASKLIDD